MGQAEVPNVLAPFSGTWGAIFLILFTFRYARLVINLVSYHFLYKPTPLPTNPTLFPSDCLAIIPTVAPGAPENPGFDECLEKVFLNEPGAVLIVTVGNGKLKQINEAIERVREQLRQKLQEGRPDKLEGISKIDIRAIQTDKPSKRKQLCHALRFAKAEGINKAVTVLADDHVYWKKEVFLEHTLAPFEDPEVGGVGTNKHVRRKHCGWGMSAVFEFLGATYLIRHTLQIMATNAIDGGVFVLSGRTSAHRSKILMDPEFLEQFPNEHIRPLGRFGPKIGPIGPDDDNFITRWEVNKGYKQKFQFSEADNSLIETDLGEDPQKYLNQCLRWSRTTWRSNPASILNYRVWKVLPYTVCVEFIPSLFNFALLWDPALLYTLSKSTCGSWYALFCMVIWILASKLVKIISHFRLYPNDIGFFGHYVLFAWFHSFIKLYALITFWKHNWGGRDLAQVNADAKKEADEK